MESVRFGNCDYALLGQCPPHLPSAVRSLDRLYGALTGFDRNLLMDRIASAVKSLRKMQEHGEAECAPLLSKKIEVMSSLLEGYLRFLERKPGHGCTKEQLAVLRVHITNSLVAPKGEGLLDQLRHTRKVFEKGEGHPFEELAGFFMNQFGSSLYVLYEGNGIDDVSSQ